MTNQTNATAAKQQTQYDKLKSMIRSDTVQKQFMDMLGERAPQFLASVLSAVAVDDSLKDCDPGSILTAAAQAAVLDLPINRNLGFAWIIGYRDNKANIRRASFQMGYKGHIQLAIRTAQYQAINVTEIYEGEQIKVNRLTGAIILNGQRTGDKVIGYAAYFRLLNGFEKFVYWTAEKVEAHKIQYAPGYTRSDSPWKTAYHEMAKKTVLHELLSKYGILSIQMQKAIQVDRAEIETESRPLPDFPALDGQARDAPAELPAPEKTVEQVAEPSAQPESAEPIVAEPVDLILVGAGIVATVEEGAQVAALLKFTPETPTEQIIVTGKLYRGWLDSSGCNPEQAAKMALEGKQP